MTNAMEQIKNIRVPYPASHENTIRALSESILILAKCIDELDAKVFKIPAAPVLGELSEFERRALRRPFTDAERLMNNLIEQMRRLR